MSIYIPINIVYDECYTCISIQVYITVSKKLKSNIFGWFKVDGATLQKITSREWEDKPQKKVNKRHT